MEILKEVSSVESMDFSQVNKSMFIYNAVVGEGGFGSVFSALVISKKRWVAIKEIRKYDLLVHNHGPDMLFNELNALKRLSHSFIVPLHLAFTDPIACYMLFDLKLGGDLRHFLKNKVCFEEKDVAFFVACLGSALAYSHSRGVIHRDIKPENILVDQDGYPYLADYGVAYVHETPTSIVNGYTLSTNMASGTKQYLAPEVFTKLHIHGPESDYWSLGVIAYEMIYGNRPFQEHCPVSFIHYVEAAYRRKQENLTNDNTTIPNSNNNANTYDMKMDTTLTTMSSVSTELDHSKIGLPQIHTHWEFDENEMLPYELQVPLPIHSPTIGRLSIPCLSLIDGLLEIRPPLRIGSPLCTRQLFCMALLTKYKLSNEMDLLDKKIQPFFVPGRKFLVSNDNIIGNPQKDPYLKAIGREPRSVDLNLSRQDQAKFEYFQYASESFSSIFL